MTEHEEPKSVYELVKVASREIARDGPPGTTLRRLWQLLEQAQETGVDSITRQLILGQLIQMTQHGLLYMYRMSEGGLSEKALVDLNPGGDLPLVDVESETVNVKQEMGKETVLLVAPKKMRDFEYRMEATKERRWTNERQDATLQVIMRERSNGIRADYIQQRLGVSPHTFGYVSENLLARRLVCRKRVYDEKNRARFQYKHISFNDFKDKPLDEKIPIGYTNEEMHDKCRELVEALYRNEAQCVRDMEMRKFIKLTGRSGRRLFQVMRELLLKKGVVKEVVVMRNKSPFPSLSLVPEMAGEYLQSKGGGSNATDTEEDGGETPKEVPESDDDTENERDMSKIIKNSDLRDSVCLADGGEEGNTASEVGAEGEPAIEESERLVCRYDNVPLKVDLTCLLREAYPGGVDQQEIRTFTASHYKKLWRRVNALQNMNILTVHRDNVDGRATNSLVARPTMEMISAQELAADEASARGTAEPPEQEGTAQVQSAPAGDSNATMDTASAIQTTTKPSQINTQQHANMQQELVPLTPEKFKPEPAEQWRRRNIMEIVNEKGFFIKRNLRGALQARKDQPEKGTFDRRTIERDVKALVEAGRAKLYTFKLLGRAEESQAILPPDFEGEPSNQFIDQLRQAHLELQKKYARLTRERKSTTLKAKAQDVDYTTMGTDSIEPPRRNKDPVNGREVERARQRRLCGFVPGLAAREKELHRCLLRLSKAAESKREGSSTQRPTKLGQKEVDVASLAERMPLDTFAKLFGIACIHREKRDPLSTEIEEEQRNLLERAMWEAPPSIGELTAKERGWLWNGRRWDSLMSMVEVLQSFGVVKADVQGGGGGSVKKDIEDGHGVKLMLQEERGMHTLVNGVNEGSDGIAYKKRRLTTDEEVCSFWNELNEIYQVQKKCQRMRREMNGAAAPLENVKSKFTRKTTWGFMTDCSVAQRIELHTSLAESAVRNREEEEKQKHAIPRLTVDDLEEVSNKTGIVLNEVMAHWREMQQAFKGTCERVTRKGSKCDGLRNDKVADEGKAERKRKRRIEAENTRRRQARRREGQAGQSAAKTRTNRKRKADEMARSKRNTNTSKSAGTDANMSTEFRPEEQAAATQESMNIQAYSWWAMSHAQASEAATQMGQEAQQQVSEDTQQGTAEEQNEGRSPRPNRAEMLDKTRKLMLDCERRNLEPASVQRERMSLNRAIQCNTSNKPVRKLKDSRGGSCSQTEWTSEMDIALMKVYANKIAYGEGLNNITTQKMNHKQCEQRLGELMESNETAAVFERVVQSAKDLNNSRMGVPSGRGGALEASEDLEDELEQFAALVDDVGKQAETETETNNSSVGGQQERGSARRNRKGTNEEEKERRMLIEIAKGVIKMLFVTTGQHEAVPQEVGRAMQKVGEDAMRSANNELIQAKIIRKLTGTKNRNGGRMYKLHGLNSGELAHDGHNPGFGDAFQRARRHILGALNGGGRERDENAAQGKMTELMSNTPNDEEVAAVLAMVSREEMDMDIADDKMLDVGVESMTYKRGSHCNSAVGMAVDDTSASSNESLPPQLSDALAKSSRTKDTPARLMNNNVTRQRNDREDVETRADRVIAWCVLNSMEEMEEEALSLLRRMGQGGSGRREHAESCNGGGECSILCKVLADATESMEMEERRSLNITLKNLGGEAGKRMEKVARRLVAQKLLAEPGIELGEIGKGHVLVAKGALESAAKEMREEKVIACYSTNSQLAEEAAACLVPSVGMEACL